MTESFGLLANGEYVLCCLDYEGEMGLGTIDKVAVADALSGERRAAIRANAMLEPVCRRCKGNLFVFDTDPLPGPEQIVDKFGRGWWPYEPGLHGRGGRWTKGEAWAYVLPRIKAHSIRVRCLSPFLEDASVKLTVRPYDEAGGTFLPGASFVFRPRKGVEEEFRVDYEFVPGRIHRIDIESPTFVPAEASGSADASPAWPRRA